MQYENPVTTDLSNFGYREQKEAAALLQALKTTNDKTQYLGDGVTVAFNTHSGYVFLTDEDYNVAMMNGHTLEDWHVCGYCGHEGFAEDMEHEPQGNGQDCREAMKNAGIETDEEE